ncbi:hypothetical protein SAMN04487944_103203 [Gracilibacillus ureilyticus]|uniref:Uncharacterized protein n=1 Tax=Gracilibacillus ureilyticus TaxID=531814 RepID=A0A1H9NM52_9BACI|nr:hypothetical protein [Gracilibacillus ureilyticus]SER36725.1 hypothetical protein SAMN04487944_103203 [Gracilibacillus ureilyticus]
MKKILALALVFFIVYIPSHYVDNKPADQTIILIVAKDIQDNEIQPATNGTDKFKDIYIPIIVLILTAFFYHNLNNHYPKLFQKLSARFYQSNYLVSFLSPK